jgi:tetratricopeptide (TPR) repeat protein
MCYLIKKKSKEVLTMTVAGEAYHLLNKAIYHYENENFEMAITLLDEALLLNPDIPEVHYWRGKVATHDLNQESLEVAIVHLSEAIRLKPDYADAYFERGKVYIQKGEFEEAKKDLEEATNRNPKIKEAYSLLAQIELMHGNDEKAMEYLNKVSGQEGDDRYYYSLGKIFYNAGKYQQAIDQFNKVIEKNKYFVDAYVYKAHSLAHLGLYEDAIENLRKAVILVPEEINYFLDMAKYYFELAKKQVKEGKKVQATENFIKGLQIDYNLKIEPMYVPIMMEAVEELIEEKNFKEANDIVDQLELLIKEPEYQEYKEPFEKLKKKFMKVLPLKDKVIKFITDIYTK